jgi:hypothetical protein
MHGAVLADAQSAPFWRSVFERRAPHSIPAVEDAAQTERRQGNTTRDITGSLLEALTQAYREAAAVTSQ